MGGLLRKGWCCVAVCCVSTIEQKPGRRRRAELKSLIDLWVKQGLAVKGSGVGGDLKRTQLGPWGPCLRVTSDNFVNAVSLQLFTYKVKMVIHTSEALCEASLSSFKCSV